MESMTGYGKADLQNYHCEIYTLNHRFFDASISINPSPLIYEYKIRNILAKKIKRGRVTLKLSCDNGEMEWVKIKETVNLAIKEVIKSRKIEGKNIKEKLKKYVNKIERLVKKIKILIPLRDEEIKEMIDKLTTREEVKEEIISILKKDVEEELNRLLFHISQFKKKMNCNECGKYLSFLTQEMNRELNTLSAKAKDTRISQLVSEIKFEIEHIIEQVENVK